MASKTKARGREKGAGTLEKRGARFLYRYRIDGVRKSAVLRNDDGTYCTTKPQAEEAAAKIVKTSKQLDTLENVTRAIAEIRHLKKSCAAEIADVWSAFEKSPNRPQCAEKHTREQRREFSKFAGWLAGRGVKTPSEVTPTLAGEYMAEVGANVSNRCFNVYLGFLRLIFGLGMSAVGLEGNPFDGIKRRQEQTESRRDFTPEQVQAIFACFHDGFSYTAERETLAEGGGRERKAVRMEWRPMYAEEMETLLKICCFTGADGQSGCLMKWEGVNLANRTISYIREKTKRATGGRVITLPIHPVLYTALEQATAWRENGNPYILPNVARRYQANHTSLQKDVQKIIRIALGVDVTNHDTDGKRARGASVYSLHSFRHTFVSFCANAGISLDVVAEIVGHGNPVMTRHYSHIHDEAKQKAINALPVLGDDVLDVTPSDAETEAREQLRRLADSLPMADVLAILKQHGK